MISGIRHAHSQRRGTETQRRRDPSRCSSVWRGFGRRPTARYHWAVQPPQKRAFVPVSRPSVLRSSSAGLASSLLHSMDGMSPHSNTTRGKQGRTHVPQARRPVRRPAATNACVRSRRASHRRQAITDRLSFCRRSWHRIKSPATAPLRLCDFALFARVGGFCVSAALRGWEGGWLCVFWGEWADLSDLCDLWAVRPAL